MCCLIFQLFATIVFIYEISIMHPLYLRNMYFCNKCCQIKKGLKPLSTGTATCSTAGSNASVSGSTGAALGFTGAFSTLHWSLLQARLEPSQGSNAIAFSSLCDQKNVQNSFRDIYLYGTPTKCFFLNVHYCSIVLHKWHAC